MKNDSTKVKTSFLSFSLSISTYLFHFHTNQIAGWNVSVAEFLDEFLTLSSFATAWGTGHEGDLGVSKLLPDVELDFRDHLLRVFLKILFLIYSNV